VINTQQYLQPAQTATVRSATDIGGMLDSIMPLVMIMMVFMMITPMMKGMSEGFKA